MNDSKYREIFDSIQAENWKDPIHIVIDKTKDLNLYIKSIEYFHGITPLVIPNRDEDTITIFSAGYLREIKINFLEN